MVLSDGLTLPALFFLSGAAHCMRRQFELAQTALVRLAAERRFPRTPSRCAGSACFGRRVHCAFVYGLPPGGGWVGGLTGGLVRRLVGTGIPGPQGRGVGSQHCSFLLGGRIPRTPSRRGRFVCFGRRVHGSLVCELPPLLWGGVGGLTGGTGPPLGGDRVAFLPRGGRWSRRLGESGRGAPSRTVRHGWSAVWWEPGYLVLRDGVWAPSTVLSCLGDVSPKPPAVRGICLLWSASARAAFVRAAAAALGRGWGLTGGTGPPFGRDDVHGAPHGLVSTDGASYWRLASGVLLHGFLTRPWLGP